MKKAVALLAALSLIFAFAACGKTNDSGDAGKSTTAAPLKIEVGASPSPHAEILNHVKPILAKQGVELTVREFTDYVLPNTALAEGDIAANYFQHKPYLDDFNVKNKANLTSAGGIHFEPLGIYAGKTGALKDIKNGATIAVPNDTTNEARALQLLEANGILKLKSGVGLAATKKDIAENPHNVEIKELAAEQIPRSLSDVDFGVINGNYALAANVGDKKIASESADSDAANQYANIIAVKSGNENNEAIKKLIAVLKSDDVKKWIREQYKGAVVPVN